jgi:hypothetical protein
LNDGYDEGRMEIAILIEIIENKVHVIFERLSSIRKAYNHFNQINHSPDKGMGMQ